MSSGARVTTHYVKETVPGTTPTLGSWKTMRVTGNTLTPTPTTEESEEINASRISTGSVTTGLTIAGDLSAELSYGSFDDWLEAAFFGNWSSDVLTVGTTRHTFSVQKGYADVNTYHLFRGCHVSTAAIEIPEEGKVTLTLGLQAMDYVDAAVTYVTGSPTAASATPLMSSLSVGDIKIDGVSVTGQACVSAMTINIDNSLVMQRCLGSGKLGPSNMFATEAVISGTMTLAWSAKTYSIWKEQISRKTFAVEFPIQDSEGNKYIFNLPAVEVQGDLPSAGKRDIVQVELQWTVARQAPTITREPFDE